MSEQPPPLLLVIIDTSSVCLNNLPPCCWTQWEEDRCCLNCVMGRRVMKREERAELTGVWTPGELPRTHNKLRPTTKKFRASTKSDAAWWIGQCWEDFDYKMWMNAPAVSPLIGHQWHLLQNLNWIHLRSADLHNFLFSPLNHCKILHE
jgi:hypothetical protein